LSLFLGQGSGPSIRPLRHLNRETVPEVAPGVLADHVPTLWLLTLLEHGVPPVREVEKTAKNYVKLKTAGIIEELGSLRKNLKKQQKTT
jgi:hypothetical protein